MCTGDISNKGLHVWDLVRGEKLRHLQSDKWLGTVKIENTICATHEYIGRYSTDILLYNLSELVQPADSRADIWHRRVRGDDYILSIDITNTCLFAVYKHDYKIIVWDFSL